MIKAQDIIFKEYLDTLKNISRKKQGREELTQSTLLAVDFDKYTEDVYRGQNTPSSVDALYSAAQFNYLIEFKGGNPSNIKTKKLHKKNKDSVNTLAIKAGETENTIKEQYIFVLVYKPEEEAEQEFTQAMGRLAGEYDTPFNLDVFKGSTFLDVHAISAESFNSDFIHRHLTPSP